VHRSPSLGQNNGRGEPSHPSPENDNALPCGYEPDPNGRVASMMRVGRVRPSGLAGSRAREDCAVGGGGRRQSWWSSAAVEAKSLSRPAAAYA
jgi:hypothetical protein